MKAADDYWAATRAVGPRSAKWDRIAAARGEHPHREEADHGTVIAGRVLEIADEIQAGKTRAGRMRSGPPRR